MDGSNQPSTPDLPPTAPPLVRELSPEQFALWKHNPITQMVMRYLRDAKKMLCHGHLDRWQTRQLLPDGGEDEARGRAAALEEVATLELTHIQQFYEIGEEPLIPEETDQQSNGEET